MLLTFLGTQTVISLDMAVVIKCHNDQCQWTILWQKTKTWSSQLMAVSNVNTLLITRVTELEKLQAKMEQYSIRNYIEISTIFNEIKI